MLNAVFCNSKRPLYGKNRPFTGRRRAGFLHTAGRAALKYLADNGLCLHTIFCDIFGVCPSERKYRKIEALAYVNV